MFGVFALESPYIEKNKDWSSQISHKKFGDSCPIQYTETKKEREKIKKVYPRNQIGVFNTTNALESLHNNNNQTLPPLSRPRGGPTGISLIGAPRSSPWAAGARSEPPRSPRRYLFPVHRLSSLSSPAPKERGKPFHESARWFPLRSLLPRQEEASPPSSSPPPA